MKKKTEGSLFDTTFFYVVCFGPPIALIYYTDINKVWYALLWVMFTHLIKPAIQDKAEDITVQLVGWGIILVVPIALIYYTDISMAWYFFLLIMIFGLICMMLPGSDRSNDDIGGGNMYPETWGWLIGVIMWFAGGFGFHFYYNFLGIESLLEVTVILIISLFITQVIKNLSN